MKESECCVIHRRKFVHFGFMPVNQANFSLGYIYWNLDCIHIANVDIFYVKVHISFPPKFGKFDGSFVKIEMLFYQGVNIKMMNKVKYIHF